MAFSRNHPPISHPQKGRDTVVPLAASFLAAQERRIERRPAAGAVRDHVGSERPGAATPLQAQRMELASRITEDKQRRIDQLEALLWEFKKGLQELLAEATRRSDALRESDAQRQQLANLLASSKARINELTRRCESLERQVKGDGSDRTVVEFAAAQVERLKRDELAAATDMKRIRESRAEAERFLLLASRRDSPAAPVTVASIVERLTRR